MDPQLADGNGGPPTLAHVNVTKAVCDRCRVIHTWENVPVASLFCECGGNLIITATTGETIEQAIQAAAQELPEKVEPVQQTLPGTRPAFDVTGALDMIEEAAQEARVAEAAYEGAKAVAKRHRDAADLANTTLRDLIRDLAERRHDARYETQGDDTDVSRPDLQQLHDRDEPADDVSALRDSGTADGDALVHEAAAEPTRATGKETDATKQVATLTGRAHVINATLDGCVVCGIGFTPYPEHQAGDPFGMNCTGYPEDRPEWLQERLADAGADQVPLDSIALWTPEQRGTARLWALDSIEAHEQDEPGKRTSIAWPAHVSLAHHGPESGTHTQET